MSYNPRPLISGFNFSKMQPIYLWDSSVGSGGAYRAATPSDFAANVSLTGASISINSIAVTGGTINTHETGIAQVFVSNALSVTGLTVTTSGPVNITGFVNSTGFKTQSGLSNSLITGGSLTSSAFTGNPILSSTTINNTIYYRFSGNNANSNATFGVEARDPIGNWGYILDTVSLTGNGLNAQISTFSTPVSNGIRGFIPYISGGSGYCYLDSSY